MYDFVRSGAVSPQREGAPVVDVILRRVEKQLIICYITWFPTYLKKIKIKCVRNGGVFHGGIYGAAQRGEID